MNEEKSMFNDDVVKKLENLALMYEQPNVFLDEYFASIRRTIDINLENFFQLVRNKHEENLLSGKCDSSEMEMYNAVLENAEQFRLGFMGVLEELEQIEIPVGAHDASQILCDLTKRVNAFIASRDFGSSDDIEEAYVQLALDIIDATNEQERRLLAKRCAVFLPKEKEIGCLVRIDEDGLTRDELSCLK